MPLLQHALKEWSVAVDALAQGETILLLRKGGIHEKGGRFTVPYAQVLLYPTYEHQKQSLLKPPYRSAVQTVAPGWHPDQVLIQTWATIDHVFQVTQLETVEALLPYHIWTAKFVTERLKWQAQQPLYLLLLRAYRLPEPIYLPWQPAYGGCRSWLDVRLSIDASDLAPALDHSSYQRQCQQIRAILEPQKPTLQNDQPVHYS